MFNIATITDFLTSSVALAIPIIYAAIGGVYSERAGVFNIGLEGMMLIGAFSGVVGAYTTGNLWYGLAFSVFAGIIIGLLHAVLCISLKINQIISGLLIVIFALGLTAFLNGAIFGITRAYEILPSFPTFKIPLLGNIPLIGPALFNQIWLGYIAFAILLLANFIMYHTTWGLAIRAVGENPSSADAVGINVIRIQYACVIISGILASVGGAYLSLGLVHTFIDNMTAGRGFIAVAAVIFGGWRPIGAFYGALLFGASDSLQLRLQSFGLHIPSQILSMLPYVLTLVVLAGIIGRTRPPTNIGIPYEREKK
jgi:ABC-type uncharacterized transport system permease subunit